MRTKLMIAAAAAVGFAAWHMAPCCAPATSAAFAQEGGSDKDRARAAMQKSFDWLVKQQNENGSFGKIPGMDPKAGEAGISALALRAMAKAPAEIRKGLEPAMAKTADYLLKLQAKDGSITNPGAGLTTYRTSIALMAFNAYDRKKFSDAIDKARDFLEKTQWWEGNGLDKNPAEAKKSPYYGGWGYDQSGTKPDADMSNVHFAIEALKEAGVAEDSDVWKRAVTFLQRCQNRSETNDLKPTGIQIGDDGGFMYDPALDHTKSEPKQVGGALHIPSYASITYAGLMSLLHANVAKDDGRVKGAYGWIQKNYTLEENRGLGGRANPQGSKQGLYYFFHTFAKALDAWGDRTIKDANGTEHAWADELSRRLVELQKPEGFWQNDVKRWWEDDPVLCSTYSLLALETAYKWLPGGEGAGAPEGESGKK
jgi:squalene-hopene/tetraprenyl-beta-curcumene cyclase